MNLFGSLKFGGGGDTAAPKKDPFASTEKDKDVSQIPASLRRGTIEARAAAASKTMSGLNLAPRLSVTARRDED